MPERKTPQERRDHSKDSPPGENPGLDQTLGLAGGTAGANREGGTGGANPEGGTGGANRAARAART
jgi:hypothetical protein